MSTSDSPNAQEALIKNSELAEKEAFDHVTYYENTGTIDVHFDTTDMDCIVIFDFEVPDGLQIDSVSYHDHDLSAMQITFKED